MPASLPTGGQCAAVAFRAKALIAGRDARGPGKWRLVIFKRPLGASSFRALRLSADRDVRAISIYTSR
jgi:hypothetical protein